MNYFKYISSLASRLYKDSQKEGSLIKYNSFREAQIDAANLLKNELVSLEFFAIKYSKMITRLGVILNPEKGFYFDLRRKAIRKYKPENLYNVYFI